MVRPGTAWPGMVFNLTGGMYVKDKDFYINYMASNEWRLKRLARLKLDEFTCQTCNEKEYLEVHHRTYERLGDENVETDLITLCSECHKAITDLIRRRRYGKRDHKPNLIDNTGRQKPNGMEGKKLQIDLSVSYADAQWADRRPDKQVRKSTEVSFIEESQNGRRLRRDGQD